MMPVVMSLAPVPDMKPRKAPMLALKESHTPLSSKRNSPRKAPASEPRMIPKGENMPMKRPTIAPTLAALWPPVTFVNHAGTK